MSKIEKEKKTKVNSDSEIIEAEIIKEPNDDNIETVIVKKGSFLSILAFILSASALTVCAYLYVNLIDNKSNKSWQAPLVNLEKANTQKFSQLYNQLKQIKKTNSELQVQLKTIEGIAASIQPTNPVINETYDDTILQEQITKLESKFTLQNNSIQQLKKDFVKQKTSSQNNTTKISVDNGFEVALSVLQAAHIQLNIYGNLSKAKNLMVTAKNKITLLSGSQYEELAQELQTIIDKTNKVELLDIVVLNKQIDALSLITSKLTFAEQTNNEAPSEQQSASWYDNLITIRKVNDSKQTRLTQSEQHNIHQDLKNHFSMLKIALINNQQDSWNSKLAEITNLLNQYFTKNSTKVNIDISSLKNININPVYPDLEKYLNKFELSNNIHKQKSI